MESALLFGQVTSALQKNPYLDLTTLTPEINGGQVVLRGKVRSYFGKQMAQESLRSIQGICEIVNDLEVMLRPLRADETQ